MQFLLLHSGTSIIDLYCYNMMVHGDIAERLYLHFAQGTAIWGLASSNACLKYKYWYEYWNLNSWFYAENLCALFS